MRQSKNKVKLFTIFLILTTLFTFLPQISALENNLNVITNDEEIKNNSKDIPEELIQNPSISEDFLQTKNGDSNNTVFGEPICITPRKIYEEDFDVASGPNGTYHSVWFQTITRFGISVMYSYSNDSVDWSVPQTIFRMDDDLEFPKILVDENGGVHIIIVATRKEHSRIYYFSTQPNNDTFVEEIIYDSKFYEITSLELVITHNDTLNVIWNCETFESNNLIWDSLIQMNKKNITSGDWSETTNDLFNSSNPMGFGVTSRFDGIELVWIRSTNFEEPYELLYTKYNVTTDTWSPSSVIYNSEDDLSDICIIPKPDGDNYILWIERVSYYQLVGAQLSKSGILTNINPMINNVKTNTITTTGYYKEDEERFIVIYEEALGIKDNLHMSNFFETNSTWSNSTAFTINNYSNNPKILPIFNNTDLIFRVFYLDNGKIVSKDLGIDNNWLENIIVFFAGDSFTNEDVKIDSQGTTHFVCYHHNKDINEIFYQRKIANKSFWTDYETVTNELTIETQPTLIIDENDSLHVYYVAKDDVSGFYSIFHTFKEIDDLNWSNPEVIFNPSSDISPYDSLNIFYEENNDFHIFWIQYVSGQQQIGYSYKNHDMSSFASQTILANFQSESHAFDIEAEMDCDGTIHLANVEYSEEYQVTSIIYRYLENGSSWSSINIISASYNYLMKPVIIIDEYNNLELIFTESIPVSWWNDLFDSDFISYTKAAGSSIWVRQGTFLYETSAFGYYDILQLPNGTLLMVLYEFDHSIWYWRSLELEYMEIIKRNPGSEWEIVSILLQDQMEKSVPILTYNNITKEISIFSEFAEYVNLFILQNDEDNDGLGDTDEAYYRSDKNNIDSDGDGLTDGYEVKVNGTNPIMMDTDWDNLTDGEEVLIYRSNPLSDDTDRDGVLDGDEVHLYSTSPTSKDSDNDLLNDYIEIFEIGSNPILNDTDSDGMDDYWEYMNSLNLLFDDSAEDPDEDNLTNLGEYYSHTNVFDPDTDADLLSDGYEVLTYLTDPLNADTDSDTLTDWEEIKKFGTNPFLADTDGDGFTDREEIDAGTDPNDPNDNLAFRRLRTTIIASIVPVVVTIILIVIVELRFRLKEKAQVEEEESALIVAERSLDELIEMKAGSP